VKKEWLVKTLALGIVVLFIGVSCSSAISVDTKTPVINNQNEENKSYVDPNIHLTRTNLPMLKRSFHYFRNSDYYDAEIGKVMEQIIKLIEFKGSVNSEDVENILINNEITSININTFCMIIGHARKGEAIVFPLFFIELLTEILSGLEIITIIGIGGILHWVADYAYFNIDIEIKVGSKIYMTPHKGFAFGFYGVGYMDNLFPFPTIWEPILHISGIALIVFVRT
jgi:hypothetical protein